MILKGLGLTLEFLLSELLAVKNSSANDGYSFKLKIIAF